MIKCADFTIHLVCRRVNHELAGFESSSIFKSKRMNFSYRRKPLARLTLFGVAALVNSLYSVDASAQVPASLRVDPVLLGLPPPAPEEKKTAPADNHPVEVRAIEAAPHIEATPLEAGRKAALPAPESAKPPPRAPSVAPAALLPPESTASQRREAAVTPRAEDNRAPVVASKPATTSAATVPSMRVDPAMLGQAPSTVQQRPEAVPAPVPAPVGGGPDPALALRFSGRMMPLAKNSDEARPAFLRAQVMRGNVDSEFIAEGNAELRKIGTVVEADRLTYWPIEDEVEAEGQVRLDLEDDVLTGPKVRMKLEDQVGYFEHPAYTLRRQPRPDSQAAADKAFAQAFLEQQAQKDFWNSGFAPAQAFDLKPGQAKLKRQQGATTTQAHGQAERIDFEGENQVRLTQATYTTCAPGNTDWYVKVADLKLDYDHEVGEGQDGTVYFKDTPIFYTPWMSFSLNNQRKSGLLPPSIGTSSDSGFELSLPYYWNIAPHMDATITPHVMSRRGLQLKNEFRYLNTAWGGLFNGVAKAEYLPGDRLRSNDNRYAFSLLHNQTAANGFSGQIDYNKVSDDHYFTDLTSEVSQTSQSHLLQQGVLTYARDWWSASAKFQQYQTLQPDKNNPVREPYKLLPQLTVNARKPDFFLTDTSFMGQYTHFTRDTQTLWGKQLKGDSANRTVLYPQLAVPYVMPGWYVTPKLGVNVRHYGLSGQPDSQKDSLSLTLPVLSVDSGMTFERSSLWFGKEYTQTLEPRLYYVYIPYKQQDDIPIFDSALADFNFAQIFSENQFTGWDRINNANQLTAALTSRLLEPNSGNEIMRAMFGQRFYFSRNRVALTAVSNLEDDDRTWEKSDFLAAFSGQILPRLYADGAWQYNLSDRQLTRYSMGMSFRPEPGKVLNAAYRYNRDVTAPINQVDVSGQWPLSGRWHGVGRLNYSFKDSGTVLSSGSQGGRLVEGIAGLEYNGGCWVMRGVVKKLALTASNSSTSFFVQLELNDFARLGSNPLELLRRSVQGYSLINQTTVDDSF